MRYRSPVRIKVLRVIAMLFVLMSLSACTAPPPSAPARSSSATASAQPSRGTVDSTYPFGPASFWRTSIAKAPLDPGSRAMVDYLVGTINDRYGGIAAFNAHQYNSPVYVVAADTPRVRFGFTNCQDKAAVPDGLFGNGGQFEAVPAPSDAVPATGTDGSITFYSPSTDQLWEFWKAEKHSDGSWSACWGGRLDHVSKSPGYFPGSFGATATGLPNAGGQVRLSEIRRGEIDHAISIAIPAPAVATDVSWPAQRSDGFDSNPAALPEGSRLRLDPDLDLADVNLTPAGLIIAKAAQKYGFIVVDRSGSVSVIAEAINAPASSSSDPWRRELGMPDYAVLQNFPWGRLEVIQKDYGKPGS